jgi:phage head maturation protease
MRQYFAINKVDEELRMVWGYASTESVDSQGETVTKDAMKAAWADYMQFANVREMHQPWAAGVVKEYEFDDVGVKIGAKIVDDSAWQKVVEGVYKGFSIGGKTLPGGYDATTKTISALKLTEISLVDRPANPEALIEMFKADNPEDDTMKTAGASPVDKVAELISKGAISSERLLELVEQDITKSSTETSAPSTSGDGVNTITNPQAGASVTPEVEKPVEPSALQKTIRVLGTGGDELKKCLYDVSWFSDLVQSLAWLQRSTAYEAEAEGDGSTMPAKLAAAVQALGDLLLQMAQEEIGELMATLEVPEGSVDSLTTLTSVVAMADKGGDLKKVNDLIDVLKAGARNSSADMERIQKAHDLLMELGAACGGETEKVSKADVAGKLNKAVHDSDIHKALGLVEKVSGEMAALRKSFDKLNSEHDTLKKAVGKMPTAPKGALKAIGKGDDVGGQSPEAEKLDPVFKADGTIDEVATAVRKIHAGGGRPIFGPR